MVAAKREEENIDINERIFLIRSKTNFDRATLNNKSVFYSITSEVTHCFITLGNINFSA